MHKFLLLCLFCFSGITVFGQFGSTYHPKIPNWHKWTEGRYYDLQNNRVSGQISWSASYHGLFGKGTGDHIMFRPSVDADKQKIESTQLRTFVTGVDSFVVSHNKQLDGYPFLLVCVDKPIKLYLSFRHGNTGTTFNPGTTLSPGTAFSYDKADFTFFFGKSPEDLTLLDSKNFIEIMTTMLAEHEDLVEKIKDKEFKVRDTPELWEIMNTRRDFLRKRKAEAGSN